jgi:XTP/dITP diphosphohydrolase
MGKIEGLLAELGSEADRSCHFACVLAIAWPDGERVAYEGRVDGTMTWPPRGTFGFGYDPVFVPLGDTRTFAEHDPEEKHRISHRAAAFVKLVADQFTG